MTVALIPVNLARIVALGWLLAGCGRGGGSRQEDVNSLRSLGAQANPLVTSPSVGGQTAKQVELTFYAAVPTGSTATLAPYQDSASNGSGGILLPTSAIDLEAGTEQYVQYNGFQLFSQKALVTVPPANAFPAADANAQILGQVEYGFEVSAAGQSEKAIGDFLVIPAGSSAAGWQNPVVSITTPLPDATLAIKNDNDLEANVTNPNNEDLRVGWFVTDGDVTNRRAASTTWNAPDSGPQTILITAHGVSSRGFAITALDCKTQ